jgi:hypothetical protein
LYICILTRESHCIGQSNVSKSSRFAEIDVNELKLAEVGGKRKSKHGETWAANAFDEWRRCQGLSTEESIGDLFEKKDIRGFVNMLLKFVLQVRKTDGSLYPPNS